MRRKDERMTAAEFADARRRLGWSTEKMSEEAGILPAEAKALEAGALPVRAETADIVRMILALEERDAVLRASGLAECAALPPLNQAFTAAREGADQEASEYALEALIAHQAGCSVCQARQACVDAHAPPLPQPRLPLWMRALGALAEMSDRLPRGLRAPPGPDGEYRRGGIFVGAVLTLLACIAIGSGVVLELVAGRTTGEDSALSFVPALPVLAVAYVVGGYFAGAVWDATRRIRHRFMGYVLRGGGTAAAMYGAMMLVLPVLAEADVPALGYLAWVAVLTVLTVFGAVVGAGKWVKDRWMDDLPDPPRERTSA